jgi:hypothetical protein
VLQLARARALKLCDIAIDRNDLELMHGQRETFEVRVTVVLYAYELRERELIHDVIQPKESGDQRMQDDERGEALVGQRVIRTARRGEQGG